MSWWRGSGSERAEELIQPTPQPNPTSEPMSTPKTTPVPSLMPVLQPDPPSKGAPPPMSPPMPPPVAIPWPKPEPRPLRHSNTVYDINGQGYLLAGKRPSARVHAEKFLCWLSSFAGGTQWLSSTLEVVYPQWCDHIGWLPPYKWNTLSAELRSLTGNKKHYIWMLGEFKKTRVRVFPIPLLEASSAFSREGDGGTAHTTAERRD
jgi:hypothetical protein